MRPTDAKLIRKVSPCPPSRETRVEWRWVSWHLVAVTRWEDTGGLDLFQDSEGSTTLEPRRQSGLGISHSDFPRVKDVRVGPAGGGEVGIPRS